MGVSELSVVIPTGSVQEKSSFSNSPTWRIVDAGVKRTKVEKKRLKQFVVAASTMPAAKDLIHQAMVGKLYPVMMNVRLQRTLSPRSVTEAVADDDEEADFADPSYPPCSVEWLIPEAAVQFEERMQTLVSQELAEFHMTSEGCGGVYFVTDENQSKLAIFKPRDEEYMAPQNPRGYVKEGSIVGVTEHPTNKGFWIGNGALRERAAYLLDAAYGGFSGVPVTALTHMSVHGVLKEGSLQAFVPSECSAEDMGTLKFAIPEVHKIGILDVRLFNTDRHAGNILLRARPSESTFEMTPIDHGFCLPSFKHLDNACFDWLYWPQAQFPFTSAELDHISSLDADRDASILRALGIEEECITTLRICTAMLKIGADAGFSLFEIASNLQREGDYSAPSPLEEIVARAVDTVENSAGVTEAAESAVFYDMLVSEVEAAATTLFAGQPKKKVRSISCFT